MKYFKLKNITKELDKRDILYNKKFDVDIYKNHNRVLIPINPGETKYLVSEKLSVNMQKMREKKYLLVVEISKEEYEREFKKETMKSTLPPKKETKKEKEVAKAAPKKDTGKEDKEKKN